MALTPIEYDDGGVLSKSYLIKDSNFAGTVELRLYRYGNLRIIDGVINSTNSGTLLKVAALDPEDTPVESFAFSCSAYNTTEKPQSEGFVSRLGEVDVSVPPNGNSMNLKINVTYMVKI